MNIEKDLRPYYTTYAKTISRNLASMQCCTLLLNLCAPGYRVLDLGSGFSSFALRYYQERLGIQVWSVDSDATWLVKTRAYCEQSGIRADNFLLWKELTMSDVFGDGTKRIFDLIFFDIGITKERVSYMTPTLRTLIHPKTFVLFDDIHKGVIKEGLERVLANYNYKEVGVKGQTMDEYGRYSRLVYAIRRKQA